MFLYLYVTAHFVSFMYENLLLLFYEYNCKRSIYFSFDNSMHYFRKYANK